MRRLACAAALSLVAAVAVPACSRRTGARSSDALVVAERSRCAATGTPPVHVCPPPDLKVGERRPVVVFLHGLGGSGQSALDELGLRAFGQRHRVFVLAPDGAEDRAGRRFWNAGAACCNFDRAPVDDVARLTALLDDWRRRPDVDAARLFVAGFSNGGFMAHRLACRAGDRLAGIASFAGAGPSPSEPCQVESPRRILEVHGDRDPIVPYQGGRVFDDPALGAHPSAEETVRAWARRLGCGGEGQPAPAPAGDIEVLAFPGCRLGAVALWRVRGGGHTLVTPERLEAAWDFLLTPRAGARR